MKLRNPKIREGSLYVCWNDEDESGRQIVLFELIGRETVSEHRSDIFCARCCKKTNYSLLPSQTPYVSMAREREGILICGKCHEGEDLRDVKIMKKNIGSHWRIPEVIIVDYKFDHFAFMKSFLLGRFRKQKKRLINDNHKIRNILEQTDALCK